VLKLINNQDIFVEGENGINTYRIPTIICTKNNVVFAFVEARHNDQGDAGHIDIVYKKSLDGGKTFGDIVVLCSNNKDTLGNPAPIYDEKLDRIVLLYCFNYGDKGEHLIKTTGATRDIYCMYTDDEGQNWSEPINITAQVKHDYWRWYATGPNHGVQMDSGRLIMTCNHSEVDIVNKNKDTYTSSHIIYSDDHGITWNLGASAPSKTNESCGVYLPNNKLMVNTRTIDRGNVRCVFLSGDEGETIDEFHVDSNLLCPICQGSIIDYKDKLIFSNPESIERENLTVKISKDYGKTWNEKLVLFKSYSSYSDLAINIKDEILCLYEKGDNKLYEKITLATIKYID